MLQHLVSMVVGRYQNDSSFVDKFSETQQILVANFIGMAKLKKSKT
jgi:hypothetical protein